MSSAWASGLTLRWQPAGGPSSLRQFLAADLVDFMHLAIVPVVLGRGQRLWDGLEGAEQRFTIEAASSPSGVTHLTFSAVS